MKINKALLFLNLLFLQSYLIRFKIFNYPSNLQEILIGAQVLTFIYAIIETKTFGKTLKNIQKHWVILCFVILTGISVILVPVENKLDQVRHLKFLFFAIILTFIFIETFKSNEEKKGAFKIAGIGAIIFGIFSVTYNLLGYNVAADYRLLGPLDAAVYLGYYLTPFFIFFTINFLENTKDKNNLLYAIISGLLMIATISMGSIAGSLIVILIYLFKRHGSQILKNKKIKSAIILTSTVVIIAVFFIKILPTLQTNYSSLDERGQIWQTSFSLLQKPQNLLLGLGFGQFQQQYFDHVHQVLNHAPLDYYVLQPHDIFLLFIFQFGILGLAFLIFCMIKTIRNLNHWPDFILLYFFIHGLIDTPFFKNDMLIILILVMELSLLKTRNQSSQS